MTSTWQLLGDILLSHSYINDKVLKDALASQKKTKRFLGDILIEQKAVRDLKLQFVLKEQSNLTALNREDYKYCELENLQYTVIDILTTGINYAAGARICEISLLKFKQNKILSRFTDTLKIDSPFPVVLKNVFKCANNLKNAKFGIDYYSPVLRQYLDKEVIISYNIPVVFDFLIKELKNNFKLKDAVYIDLLTLWRRLHPGPGHSYHTFMKFAEEFGLDEVRTLVDVACPRLLAL